MLTVKTSQMEALQRAALLGHSEPYLAHVRTYHAAACARIGEPGLKAHVTAALGQGWDVGLRTQRELLAYLDLVMVFGLDWSLPETSWLHDGLSDASAGSLSARLAMLRRQAAHRLEAASLDGNTEGSTPQ